MPEAVLGARPWAFSDARFSGLSLSLRSPGSAKSSGATGRLRLRSGAPCWTTVATCSLRSS
eukprot:12778171-Alexandrium_andersonii.AAC.1